MSFRVRSTVGRLWVHTDNAQEVTIREKDKSFSSTLKTHKKTTKNNGAIGDFVAFFEVGNKRLEIVVEGEVFPYIVDIEKRPQDESGERKNPLEGQKIVDITDEDELPLGNRYGYNTQLATTSMELIDYVATDDYPVRMEWPYPRNEVRNNKVFADSEANYNIYTKAKKKNNRPYFDLEYVSTKYYLTKIDRPQIKNKVISTIFDNNDYESIYRFKG